MAQPQARAAARAPELFPVDDGYTGNLRDESRTTGFAVTISFPTSEDDVRAVLAQLREQGCTAVTVQGARTGLAAGAVPFGGSVMDLSRMKRVTGLRQEGERFFVTVQPGVVLQDLRNALRQKRFATTGWSDESLAALAAFREAGPWFFPTDPTETSATIGGMVACNASGARSFRYGPVRPHVQALRVVLADGETLALSRGDVAAEGRVLTLVTEQGTTRTVPVPTYTMPHAKNASGYHAAPDMDAVDLFVGSDGTLGVVTEVELELLPSPAVTWGVNCFFGTEAEALAFVEDVRPSVPEAVAVEYFDADALDVLRAQRATGGAFATLPVIPEDWRFCVYVELAGPGEEAVADALGRVADAMVAAGSTPARTWVGRTDVDRECQRLFRHAVPESVNMLIDERRRTDRSITKLGSDMSVPNGRLLDVMGLYRRTLAEEGLQSAVWGHIGDNHLHVNVLPRTIEDYRRGKALFERWAEEVSAMGGAVSAEHGVGKLKRAFLIPMYGQEGVASMAATKRALDPDGLLGRGNLFDEALLGSEEV